VAVIDAYDAMVSNRCYRRGLSHEAAVQRLLECVGSQFDPVVVQAFIEIAKEEAPAVFAATGVGPFCCDLGHSAPRSVSWLTNRS